jgi:general secretion pathway protein L
MSSLIVLLPSSDVLGPGGWEAVPMPFVLLDRKGEVTRTGRVPFESLPKAGGTILVVAARDTLLLNAQLPQVTGSRLRRALPNVVEEHLIQDAQRCHIAIDPTAAESGERCLAVIDRDWFASILARFGEAGHRRLRAVPLIHCIPAVEPPSAGEAGEEHVEEAPEIATEASDDAGPVAAIASVLVVRHRGDSLSSGENTPDDGWVELALRQDALGFGMSVNAAQLDATLDELARRQPLMVYSLAIDGDPKRNAGSRSETGIEPGPGVVAFVSGRSNRNRAGLSAEHVLPLARVASMALACRFNLCQFEFANAGRARPGAGGLKPWRVALGFLGATVLVSIVAVNVQWFDLRHKRDALTAQMTQRVKDAFPGVAIVLDPHEQMTRELKRLRVSAGEVGGDDFLVLAAELAHALNPIPSTSIAEMNYGGGVLDVTFKPGTEVDEDGLKRRFAANGLSAQEDEGKWTIKPAPSRPR